MTATSQRRRRKQIASGTNGVGALFVAADQDGRDYDFSGFKDLAGVVRQVAAAFSLCRSTNDDPEARAASDGTSYYALVAFLRWVRKQPSAPRVTLSTLTLQKYQRHLLASSLASSTVWDYYQQVAAAARALFDADEVRPFLIPANLNQREARVSSKGSRTLVDLLKALPDGMAPSKANEELLRMLLLACDRWARELEARLALGRVWRQEVGAGVFTPPTEWLERPFSEWRTDRRALLEIACKLAIRCWSGDTPRREATRRNIGNREMALYQAILWGTGWSGLRSQGECRITVSEMRSYLAPTTLYMAAIMPFFLAAGVNPNSLRRLEVDQLRYAPDGPAEFASIVFRKPRAGGEVSVGPFRVGPPEAPTLPRIWARVTEATDEIRIRGLEPRQPRYLAIAVRQRNADRTATNSVRCPKAEVLFRGVLRPWLARLDGAEEPLRRIAPHLNAKVIRTTAINISNERMGRDSGLSAIPFGHQPQVLDVAYLVSERVRSDLELTMEAGQAALEEWLRAPIAVVPNRVAAIRAAGSVDAETAAAIGRDEWTGLNGMCLVNERALVVDSPINCLRMIQWLECLRLAERRMLLEQPQRWAEKYAPQIPLFEDALNDFSRRTLREAERLSRAYQLPMEEIA